MTIYQTIASSSSGNAALLRCGETRLLIDMGISCRRLCQALAAVGVRPEELTAVLISHEHRDHINGLPTYIKKYRTPIVCTPGTARQLSYRMAGIDSLLRPAAMWEQTAFGGVLVTLLATSHDCGEGAAFRIDTPDGAVGILTDTGYIPEATGRQLLGVELLVLESNHDIDLLRSGPYPYALKQRILSDLGHLSNGAAAQFALESAQAGTRRILLAHLSQENNRPGLALRTVGDMLGDWGGRLATAPADGLSEAFVLERTPCSE